MALARPRLEVLPGGRADGAPSRPRLATSQLEVIAGGAAAELERALAEAVEAAREMRLEIERRIARELERFDHRR